MTFLFVIKRGLYKGLDTTWKLTKVVVPVYFFVTLLKYTPALEWIAESCEPFLSVVGLPGEASIAIVLGNFLNLYAAIGAIASLELGTKEITVIAMMLLLSHSSFIESAVSQQTGISGVAIGFFRLVFSILIGIILNFVL